MKKEKEWHSLELEKIIKEFETDINKGLTEDQVLLHRRSFGSNRLKPPKGFRFIKLVWSQVKSPLAMVLIVAGIIAITLGELADSLVIFVAALINTSIGVFQEGKAGKTFSELASSQKRWATILRTGGKRVIESSELVPGDIILVQAGDIIPADARIIESKNLESNESALTGEWGSMQKEASTLDSIIRIPEMSNMLWSGTLIASGWGKAVVVKTGMKTEIGKIADMVNEGEVQTPFQKNIAKLARVLSVIIFFAIIVIFIIGLLKGEPLSEMFLLSVAIAVASIPEGLPVAVTVVLALGMGRILTKGGLVKHLSAAETLGSATVILTDKTGTLTQAKMQVSDIITFSSLVDLKDSHKDLDKEEVLKMAMLSGNAFIENPDAVFEEWVIRGEAMDKAILLARIESGNLLKSSSLDDTRLDFIPFDAKNRFSASMNMLEGARSRIHLKGSPELVLDISSKVYNSGKVSKMTKVQKNLLEKAYSEKTNAGMRLIAVSYKEGKWKDFNDCSDLMKEVSKSAQDQGKLKDTDFIFVGFIAFHDPIRLDVRDSIRLAQEAGIRTIMATGDHKVTAEKIAEEAGITKSGKTMEGFEIDGLDEKELRKVVGSVSIFARVLPHQKMRIAQALQKNGEVVAMTGDGVNDAPALSNADIGVALGSGTEIAKEASDIVLLDNNFSIIVSAIEEGRRIVSNLKKIVSYLLSTGFSELIIVGVSLTAGLPLPILPVQILWTNIIEEGFMNFAFAFEPKEDGLMDKQTINKGSSNILTKDIKILVFTISLVTASFLIGLYLILLSLDLPIEEVRTIMFAALSIDSIFFTFSLKNLSAPIWRINIFSNKYLVLAFFASILSLVVALFLPPLQKLLSLTPLSFYELILIFGIGLFNLICIETAKYFIFEMPKKSKAT